VKTETQQLIQLFEGLDQQGRNSLLDYAEFLSNKSQQNVSAQDPQVKHEPVYQERPSEETVLAAIKRLRVSYFMIDTDGMINQTSSLMTQFMLQGRPASEVIDDLELLFKDHYQKYLES
jgi:CDP-glycerol glycerophosphotransferase (TagB/SpsB family)